MLMTLCSYLSKYVVYCDHNQINKHVSKHVQLHMDTCPSGKRELCCYIMQLLELTAEDLFQLKKSKHSSKDRRTVVCFPSVLGCTMTHTSSNVVIFHLSTKGVTSTCCMTHITLYGNHCGRWGGFPTGVKRLLLSSI